MSTGAVFSVSLDVIYYFYCILLAYIPY